jgi:hypothetical protein
VFSRARWCFRQCAWPARRHARKNHWRARENSAEEKKWQWLAMGLAGANGWDLRFEVREGSLEGTKITIESEGGDDEQQG